MPRTRKYTCKIFVSSLERSGWNTATYHDAVSCPSDCQAVEELVAERFALGDSGKTAVLDLGGIEADAVLGELEALLNERRELADAATLLAEHFLGVCCADNDIGRGRSDADFDTGVALLSELALEELVELGVEDTVGDELPALGTVRLRSEGL